MDAVVKEGTQTSLSAHSPIYILTELSCLPVQIFNATVVQTTYTISPLLITLISELPDTYKSNWETTSWKGP
jgi:hypothetical protein